ncbi:hypothetical protein [Burkholderia cepacia]|uniref:hypothetical protein n=1 Tax=Burkholderia cepacia TaxID=292 RepID=UPI001CF284A2|nr:hypothetical protein [Burkholderia cepacia]MCA8135071.1 hypothetical protein [Burkholderia cepacia]HEM7892002.1 hypothetical protein [Burkholderia cepacia]HEM8512734.1 hypothetical protein [Burkholderia cepacia]
MSAASNARQANKTSETSATDARRSGDQHTVTPTRPRVRAAKPASRDARWPAGRGSGGSGGSSGSSGSSGPVAAHDGDRKGNPLWEDDGGAMPPEEWS